MNKILELFTNDLSDWIASNSNTRTGILQITTETSPHDGAGWRGIPEQPF